MDYKKFNEYLNSRGSLDAKGKVNKTGDEVDMKKPKAKDDPHNQKRDKGEQIKEYLSPKGKMVGPIESEDGDTYQDAGKREFSPDGNTSPYRASGKSPKGWDRETGFADTGAKELVYDPDVKVPTNPAGGNSVPSWPKNKDDKNSSPATQTEARQLRSLAMRMRTNGTLPDFIEAVLEFPEVRKSLQQFFAETVAPPMVIDHSMKKKRKPWRGDEEEELADVEGEDELIDPEDEDLDDEGDLEDDLEDEDIDPDDEFAPEDEGDDMEDMPMPPPKKGLPMKRPPRRPLDDHPMMRMMRGM